MHQPNFLPSILNLQGSWDDILEILYSVFTKDFKNRRTAHCGIKVIYDNRILPDGDGKEEGFWHVISKVNHQTKQRVPDFRRAERLPWARLMMENHTRAELRVFDYDHGSAKKGVRRYIWLADFDYVLVVQQKPRSYFWITAYYVDSKGKREDLKRRYKNRL